MVSHRRLEKRRRLPRATAPWVLDSGGFSELNLYGDWVTTPVEYRAAVHRYRNEIGNLAWAAPMDWMCEPIVLEKTHLTVAEHQRRTVDNFVRLRDADSSLPFIPVLQGWELDDYLRCIDLYDKADVDLGTLDTVGVGTVCRRQHTGTVDRILSTLAETGLQLHGFGVKTTGLTRYADALSSADSLAWSYRARNAPPPPLAGCSHRSCSNCLRFALAWREKVLRRCSNQQLRMV